MLSQACNIKSTSHCDMYLFTNLYNSVQSTEECLCARSCLNCQSLLHSYPGSEHAPLQKRQRRGQQSCKRYTCLWKSLQDVMHNSMNVVVLAEALWSDDSLVSLAPLSFVNIKQEKQQDRMSLPLCSCHACDYKAA